MKTLAIAGAVLCLPWNAAAQVTERVSLDSSGSQAGLGGDLSVPVGAVISIDGRFVAFISPAALDAGDTNGAWDVFVRDRLLGATERVSVSSSGAQTNGNSGIYGMAMSADGRFVAFESLASNLVAGDTNGARDIFVRDRLSGTTERVSVDSNGIQSDAGSFRPSLTPDGRFVVFASDATNLVLGDANGQEDVFIHDRATGSTVRVSVSTGGVEGNSYSEYSAVSADGRYVAFESYATNLVVGDVNGKLDVFIRDCSTGTTSIASLSSAGVQGNGHSNFPTLSADGRLVAFVSEASNLVSGDTNASWDVFVRDNQVGTTERVSVATGGTQANGDTNLAALSPDGRYVAFTSSSTNLIPNTLAGLVYVRDRLAGTTELVSMATGGIFPDSGCSVGSITENGRYVAFRSYATNLVPGDTNGATDVFIHDRLASGLITFCDPGVSGVIACPCGNQPSGLGRGCDNSAATGGASLSASGIAYLSIDSLAFTTSDERPSATSILLQGDVSISNGLVLGQGVRCVGGTLKRMYVKTAVNGSIIAPDFTAGDPTVSARSAQLGVPIQPGQPYYFLVYYRDPIVLGGCSAGSTFNATQTGSVTYWP